MVDDLYNKGFRMEKEKGVNSKNVHPLDPFKAFETSMISFFLFFFSYFLLI